MPDRDFDKFGRSEEAASLRALIDTIVDGVVIIDSRGLVRVFNPACERLFAYARDEVIGQNVSMLMPEPYRREHDSYLEAYRRTGQKKIIGIGREVVGRRKDGRTFPMELSVGETRLGEGNAYVGVIRDISERKEGERRLRDSEARLRAIIDTAVDAVILIDAAGLIRMFNPASEWTFGYRSREVLGKNVSMLMPEPYRAEHDGYLQRYRRTGERRIIGIGREVLGLRKDGTIFPMELSVGETVQSGDQVFVGIIRDISERKRAEERQKALAVEVDHRAKNILALIQVIVRQTRAKTTDEYMQAVQGRIAAVARAHTLFSETRWSGADLRRLIDEELKPFQVGFAGRIEMAGPRIDLAPESAQSLAMALHELVTNAVKYGALSQDSGHLSLKWDVVSNNLTIHWLESGGSPVSAPSTKGVGSMVIDQAIRGQLGGTIDHEWRRDGMRCRLSIPLRKAAKQND